MNKKELLKITEWYHATTFEGLKKIKSLGIIATINEKEPRDFGYGFYMSQDLDWSFDYILNTLCDGESEEDRRKAAEEYVVLKIRFDLKKIIKRFGVESLRFFKSQDINYANFVADNRVKYDTYNHEEKMVAGPMANKEQIKATEKCRSNNISREVLIDVLQGDEDEIQLLLHSQEVCDTIDTNKDILERYPWKEAGR